MHAGEYLHQSIPDELILSRVGIQHPFLIRLSIIGAEKKHTKEAHNNLRVSSVLLSSSGVGGVKEAITVAVSKFRKKAN